MQKNSDGAGNPRLTTRKKTKPVMISFRLLLIVVVIATTLGCAGMTATQQRVLSGSAIGTAAGVGAAAIMGGPLFVGALTGAAAGAVGGIVVDEMEGSH
jgi:osmotically inducible lipoprotein OsmB